MVSIRGGVKLHFAWIIKLNSPKAIMVTEEESSLTDLAGKLFQTSMRCFNILNIQTYAFHTELLNGSSFTF